MLKATRVLRHAMPKSNPWTETLKLPTTPFPARPSAEDLPSLRNEASETLYTWQQGHRPESDALGSDNTFVLHDGPPYANGPLHTGHALNKILKDLIVRTQLSRGKRVIYQPGWDCHGLPIELKALQAAATAKSRTDSAGLTPVEVRNAARQLAQATVQEQKQNFVAWGILADWNNPYLTMDKSYILRQLDVFKAMVANGLIHRQFRPVHWSPSSQSALAEAELEYDDNHRVTAAFVKFPILKFPIDVVDLAAYPRHSLKALIWTTTPWTLPANMAIAVRADLDYSIIEFETSDNCGVIQADSHGDKFQELLLVATERIEALKPYLPPEATIKIIASLSGSALVNKTTYVNPLTGETCRVVHADFVTSITGTGLVHMAPGHGMDDYLVLTGLGYQSIKAPVNHRGQFTKAAYPHEPNTLNGLDVETDGANAVLKLLESPQRLPVAIEQTESLVLATHKFRHRNPIDWRTKRPVIMRATEQWFARVSKLIDPACKVLDLVKFVPDHLRTKLADHVRGRHQWCISRQRAWGVPIPALFKDGKAVLTPQTIDHIKSVIESRGIDAWWSDTADEPAWIPCGLEPGNYVRGKDTMDVWFDSGSSWASLEKHGHGYTVVEGTDQHRGWFQSSLLTKLAQQFGSNSINLAQAPFSAIVTHGFVLDQHGRKMSKSQGNVVSPAEILSGSIFSQTPKNKGANHGSSGKKPSELGPDVLHLWVASNDYTKDISLSPALVQSVHQSLQKYRVTFKWLLGVLNDYPVAGASEQYLSDSPSFADWIVLHQLAKTSAVVYGAQNDYTFHKAVAQINKFINVDLSATYFEIIKDRMYAGDEATRRHTQTVLYIILDNLLQMLAPVTPLLVQEVWTYIPEAQKADRLPHLRRLWNAPFKADFGIYTAQEMEQHIESLKALSVAIKGAQEEARRLGSVGSGLACSVEIYLPSDAPADFSQLMGRLSSQDELKDLFVVSEVMVLPGDEQARRKMEDEVTDPEIKEFLTQRRDWRNQVPWSHEGEYALKKNVEHGREQEHITGKIVVLPTTGEKCPRCWQYTMEEQAELCDRCTMVVAEQNGETTATEEDDPDGIPDNIDEIERALFIRRSGRGGGRRRPGRRR